MKIKIMSWNIWHGKHLNEIKEHIKDSNPDIIGLQEVIEMDKNGEKWNVAEEIAKELGYEWTYFKAFTSDKSNPIYDQGNAILSKYKIEKSTCYFLSGLELYKQTAESEPRIAIDAHISFGEKMIHIITTHLAYSFQFQQSEIRDLQMSNLLKTIHTNNTILMGDFNSSIENEVIKKISAVIQNADSNPTDPTWTVYPFDYHGHVENELKHRLDNIFVSKDITVQKFEVENSKGSDHLPVSAIIEI